MSPNLQELLDDLGDETADPETEPVVVALQPHVVVVGAAVEEGPAWSREDPQQDAKEEHPQVETREKDREVRREEGKEVP